MGKWTNKLIHSYSGFSAIKRSDLEIHAEHGGISKALSVEKPISKGHRLYNSTYMTFWKKQNCRDRKKIHGCKGLEVGKG